MFACIEETVALETEPPVSAVYHVNVLPNVPVAANTTFVFLQPAGAFANNNYIGQSSQAAAYNNAQLHFSANSTITKMTVVLTTAPGGIARRDFFLYKNGVVTTLTLNLVVAQTTASITGSISFSAFDTFSVLQVVTNGPASSSGSICLEYS